MLKRLGNIQIKTAVNVIGFTLFVVGIIGLLILSTC